MAQTGLLAGTDVVLDSGVGAVAGLEELGGGGWGVGGHQLVAPAVGGFKQRQLGAGVGFFAAANDAGLWASSPVGHRLALPAAKR